MTDAVFPGTGFFGSSTVHQTSSDHKPASKASDWNLSGSKGFFDQSTASQPEAPAKPAAAPARAEAPKPSSSSNGEQAAQHADCKPCFKRVS